MVFPLLDLPELPLSHILSFLDAKSLRKAQLAASRLLFVARKYRMKMVPTRIRIMEIRRVRCESTDSNLLPNVECYLQFVFSQYGHDVKNLLYFPIHIDSRAFIDRLEERRRSLWLTYTHPAQICVDVTFIEWMSLQCVNVHIGFLGVHQFTFTESEISLLENGLEKNKVHVETIGVFELAKYDKTEFDLLMRFTNLFSIKNLMLCQIDVKHSHILLTDSFLKMLPSLESFGFGAPNLELFPETTPRLPATFYQFPSEFVIGAAMLIDISSVRKALQEWAHNRQSITDWFINLPVEFADKDKFLEEINLPVQSLRHFSSNDGIISMKNCCGKELHVRKFDPQIPKKVLSFWFMSDTSFNS